MANLRRTHHSQHRSRLETSRNRDRRSWRGIPAESVGRLRRTALIAGAGGLALLLVLAWIDGGEEPLRPIAQQVVIPGSR